MASFGRYETVRELYRTGYTVVYSGRVAADPAEKFVIKVFQPSALLLEGEQVKTELDLFLNSASIQQKAAESGAQHWAPIYECGSITDGVFYATDKYDRSLQQLIDGRVTLTPQALCAVVESVAKGLIELKQACVRPHGNLKATNVLIAGAGDISQTTIVLSDPLPDEHIDTSIHWDRDLRAMAEFIYQLVIHRPSPTVDGWQVPDSKEWAVLGKQANDWRNLCNRLLTAHLRPGAMTIETLIEELAQLKKVKPVLSSRRLIVAGLIIAIVGAVILRLLWPKPAPPEQAEWENLCTEYEAWVDDFRRSVDKQRKVRWSKDAELGEIVDMIGIARYPYDVMVKRGKAEIWEIVGHPEWGEQGKTQAALKAIEDIKSFFDPNSVDDPNAYKPWPLLVKIRETANKFEERGWQKPGAYLGFLVEAVKLEPNKPIAENVDTVLGVRDTLNEITSQWDKIENDKATMDGSKAPTLAKFGNYIQSEVISDKGPGTKDDLNSLGDKLKEIGSLAGELAEFINSDWQSRVDREAFLEEVPALEAETPAKNDFERWLQRARDYYILTEDPRGTREKWKEKTLAIDGDIGIIERYDPNRANEFTAELSPIKEEINRMFEIRGIEKNKAQIEMQVRTLDTKLVNLKQGKQGIDVELAKWLEEPKDWWAKTEKEGEIAASNVINEEWRRRRDQELRKHELADLERDIHLFVDVKLKIERQIREGLESLDNTLPLQIGESLRPIDWNNRLSDVYGNERERVFGEIIKWMHPLDDVPDVKKPEFAEQWNSRLQDFGKWRNELDQLIVAFNDIEGALDACYLLDHELPQKAQTLRSFHDKWKDADILKEPRVSAALSQVTNRIGKLIEIENLSNRGQLVGTALDSGSKTEAVYAAWVKLGELSDPKWPAEQKDLQNEREIQNRLSEEFGKLKEANRKQQLLTMLAEVTLEREIVFKKANIERYRKTVEQNYADDKVLAEFTKFVPTEINRITTLRELETLENLAQQLAKFVSRQDWQNDNYRKDLFWTESDFYRSYEPFTMNKIESIVQAWLKQVEYYKIVEDPRKDYNWEEKIEEITELIKDELDRIQSGSSKQSAAKPKQGLLGTKITEITKLFENVLTGKLTGPSKETVAKLEQEHKKLAETVQKVDAMRALPAIEKNKDKIDATTCNKLWQTLLNHEATVKSIIKPGYCEHLELLQEGVQRLVFTSTTKLGANFEPVNISRLQAIAEKRTPINTVIEFVQGSAESILSLPGLTELLNKLPLSEFGELLNKTVEVADWDQIRKAVNEGRREWLDFFHTTTDAIYTNNVGWPKYIVSKQDPSVVFRFIPAGPGNPEPFYMATHEITNAQYLKFMQESGAMNKSTLPGWSQFTDQAGKTLILATISDNPHSAINWQESSNTFVVAEPNEDIPVTYVTYYGAQSYANWLGAQLPTASQHEYACRARTKSTYPWGDDLSQIPSYAHVRAIAWQQAASEYNSKKDSAVEFAPTPAGAVKDYLEDGTLDENKLVHQQATYNSAWPIANASQPNPWGLYDMIGNVWEWCRDDQAGTQSVICGGSCLSPPEYARPDSKLPYQGRACDVGFRVIVPAG